MNNPYISIINSLKPQETSESKHPFGLATVISTKPLAIRFGDLELDSSNLMINEQMIKDYQRRVAITETKVVSTTTLEHDGGQTSGSHDHRLTDWLIEDGLLNMNNDILEEGDEVFVIGINEGQLFIILAKVVNI